jgi:hypothetical protein
VCGPVNFHNKTRLETVEISNEWTQWALLAELPARQFPVSQRLPEPVFRRILLGAKRPGTISNGAAAFISPNTSRDIIAHD